MLLRGFYLYLDPLEYPDELVVRFGFRSRHVCHYVERAVAPLRFRADGFDRVCVQGSESPGECRVVAEHSLLAPVKFDVSQYVALESDAEHEFFIGMLSEGLGKCKRRYALPYAEVDAAIDALRRGGYRNEWLHKRKILRGTGLVASLLCSLDPARFVLTLRLERRGAPVFEKPILETKPDEIIFKHQFKDVGVDDGAVVVWDAFGRPLYTLEVSSLARGSE